MANENFISKEYEQLMVALSQWTDEMVEQYKEKEIYQVEGKELQTDIPLLVQVKPEIDKDTYFGIYTSFQEFMAEHMKDKALDFKGLTLYMERDYEQWIEKTLAIDHEYFAKVSEELSLPAWVPMYIAENLIRPFLRIMSVQLKDKYKSLKVSYVCKFCDEPVRLSRVGSDGQKEVVCPRCYAAWVEKKIQCSVCKEEDHTKMTILKIDEDDLGQIQVCYTCGGYTKLIEKRKLIRKNAPDLLDLYSVQFDYIAQEYIENNKEKFEENGQSTH